MKLRLFSLVRASVILALLLTLALSGRPPAAAQARPDAAPPTVSRPSGLLFIENAGQFPAGARFQVRGPGITLWLADDAVWLTALEPAVALDAGSQAEAGEGVHVKLSFPGANPHPRLEPFNRVDTRVSFFTGSDPAQWRSNVPAWGGVRYVELYPGIDLELSGEQGQLVPRVVARPGADLGAVRLLVEGADVVVTRPAGDALRLLTSVGEADWPLLRVDKSTAKVSVRPLGAQVFEVTAPFSPVQAHRLVASRPDDTPGDLFYGTFLGGSSRDSGYAIAVDGDGVAYITGWTQSSDFPTTAGAFDTSYNGGYSGDAFVAKLDAAGSALEYATFVGGSNSDGGSDIAIDADGVAYVTGSTDSTDFPTTPGAFDTTFNSVDGGDAFVIKLNAAGSALEYATFLGGFSFDSGNGIGVDGSGAVYITGGTESADFPTTPGAFDTSYNGGMGDAFITKLNVAGSALDYSTFLGGSGIDGQSGLDIAVDGSGAAYVTGRTYCSDFPTTPGAFDTTLGGFADAFVTKLNATGSALDYSTYLGGSDDEQYAYIALDASGAAYITGNTASADLPTTPGGFDTSYNGNTDAFATKLNATGSDLDYSTFLGGSDGDLGRGIAVDASGVAHIVGSTSSSDLAITPNAFDTSYNGTGDVFLTKLDAAGSALEYATFLGGSDADEGRDVAVDASGKIYITGATRSSNMPSTLGAFDVSYNGGLGDAFAVNLMIGSEGYSISGRVADAGGTGLPGVTVAGGWAGMAVTNANGDYAFRHVITGTCTLTPTLEGYSFDPITRTVEVPPDATGQDFVGTQLTYSIGGRVSDVDDSPIAGVTISVTGGYSATTDVLGAYTVTNLISGTYTLTPTLEGYVFDPVTRTVHVPPDATGQDFFAASAGHMVYLPVVLRNW